ncbi:uncharacterized protein BCR38DRAFT_491109 [Pseudomassariella vexata]|uniref:Uncharacterized protein n=1 Tax=Pseudomassariella vexata TaxID=1141098 RepID=A0A1Y2D895_9PEZI|nr:uncharacterized protein BCR38DRAFT_491109 [Pseudomassariella vexata]ORY55482.1 hypothetical protein BCR38DRAFT_491109 [Pseudomassariella vexata]
MPYNSNQTPPQRVRFEAGAKTYPSPESSSDGNANRIQTENGEFASSPTLPPPPPPKPPKSERTTQNEIAKLQSSIRKDLQELEQIKRRQIWYQEQELQLLLRQSEQQLHHQSGSLPISPPPNGNSEGFLPISSQKPREVSNSSKPTTTTTERQARSTSRNRTLARKPSLKLATEPTPAAKGAGTGAGTGEKKDEEELLRQQILGHWMSHRTHAR